MVGAVLDGEARHGRRGAEPSRVRPYLAPDATPDAEFPVPPSGDVTQPVDGELLCAIATRTAHDLAPARAATDIW
jgi:hypothetical protein